MTETPSSLPVAIVGVVMRSGETLVIRRSLGPSHPGYFGPLMVHVQPGEPEEDALVSGVRKQVGLEVRPIRQVWSSLSHRGDHDLHWWLAECISGELAPDEETVSEAVWVLPSDFATLDQALANDQRFYLEVLPNLREMRSDAV